MQTRPRFLSNFTGQLGYFYLLLVNTKNQRRIGLLSARYFKIFLSLLLQNTRWLIGYGSSFPFFPPKVIKGKGCSVCFLNSQITTCLSQYLFDLHACQARRHKNKYFFYGIMYIFSILLGSLIFFFFFCG